MTARRRFVGVLVAPGLVTAIVLGCGQSMLGVRQRTVAEPPAPAVSSLPALSFTASLVPAATSVPASSAAPSTTSLLERFTTSELAPEARRVAEAITSVFENSTPQLQYGYSAVLDDGRGITAGRAGFTSATGDLVVVVRRYIEMKPSSPLAPFLPVLEDLDAVKSDDTSALSGFEAAWRIAAEDPVMRAVQDGVVNELYYNPAMGYAASLGAVLPLTLASLYDTIIQHGNGSDPDGLAALIAETNSAAGITLPVGVNEMRWLEVFLSVRKQHLLHSFAPETRTVWAASAGRCDALVDLAAQSEWALDAPVRLRAFGSTWVIN